MDDSGEAIIGATVMVKGNTGGTITDIDGNFSIQEKLEVYFLLHTLDTLRCK